jgi:hypothetical protein
MRRKQMFLHGIILKASKPVRTSQDFAALPLKPEERARLDAWASDPHCAEQLGLRILQIMATFKTRKPPAQSQSDLPIEPQLYSRDELRDMKTKRSKAGVFGPSLLDVLAKLPQEIHKFTPDGKGSFVGKGCSNTVYLGLEYWQSDPLISKIINDTISLTMDKGHHLKPIYPPEVAIAMALHGREGYKPPNPKRALHCPAQTIVGSAPAPALATPMKTRSKGSRLQHGRGREMGQELGPERQRDD